MRESYDSQDQGQDKSVVSHDQARLTPIERLLGGLTTLFVALLAMVLCFGWAVVMKFVGIRVGDGTLEAVVVLGPPCLLCAALVKQGQL